MPIARAPLIFAICPTAEPTAPEAAATTTVSPACGLPISSKPGIGGHAGHAEHAHRGRDRAEFRIDLVQPLAVGQRMGLPAGARQHDVALGESRDCSRRSPRSRCRPPSRRRSAPAPHRTDRRSCGRAYRDRATARWCAAAPRPRPAPVSRISSMRKSDALGSPTGRETRTTRFADWDMVVSSDFLDQISRHCEERSAKQSSCRRAKKLDSLRRNAPRNDGYESQAVIFASAASNAAAALGRSLKASPLSADCFCASVAVGRISATGLAPSSKAFGAIT